MPFTNSETDLKDRLIEALGGLLTDFEDDPDQKDIAIANLEDSCGAMADAIVGWLLANGDKCIEASTEGNGSGQGQGVGNMGGPVVSKVDTQVQCSVVKDSVNIV